MDTITKLSHWKQTRRGQIIAGILEGILAYIFASLAINSGALWQYFVTFVLLFGAVQNFAGAFKVHGKK